MPSLLHPLLKPLPLMALPIPSKVSSFESGLHNSTKKVLEFLVV